MAAGDLVVSTIVDGQPVFVCGPCNASCCLFPYPGDIFDAGFLYPETDLPATLHIDTIGDFTPSGTFAGDDFKYTSGDWILTNGNLSWELSNDGEAFYVADCLVGRFFDRDVEPAIFLTVEDLFLDAYTVNAVDEINRVTPCTWVGAKTGGGSWTLDYGLTTPYKFHLSSTGGAATSDDRDEPQVSPDGDYGSIIVA